jgi:DNA-binding NarL/FixJ family response regulator
MKQSPNDQPKPLGLIWVDCPHSLVTAGLVQALQEQARVHPGSKPPEDVPSCVIICANGEDISEYVKRHRVGGLDTLPILVFGSHLDLPLARDSLQAGASGFVHAEMTPEQLVRAVEVAEKGELVAPRTLLGFLINENGKTDVRALSARQREILGFVVEGLSNAEIGRRLFLSESTIKQHLRAAYKVLGVNNRTEAAYLFRRDDRGTSPSEMNLPGAPERGSSG